MTAVKAQPALAAPKWHFIEKPLDEIIRDFFGIGVADVF
jgi:hypothetical protein